MNKGTNSSKICVSIKKRYREALQREADKVGLPLSAYCRKLLEEMATKAESGE